MKGKGKGGGLNTRELCHDPEGCTFITLPTPSNIAPPFPLPLIPPCTVFARLSRDTLFSVSEMWGSFTSGALPAENNPRRPSPGRHVRTCTSA